MERKKDLSLISVVSCIAVVFLHTNGCFWKFSKEGYWTSANIIECLFYFAVPCFFMCTGVTLLNYREKYSLKVYFQKRLLKTVLPFLFWSLIGLLYGIYVRKAIDTEAIDLLYVYNGILNTSFVSIYWFFPPLFCLYLSVPLFAAVEKDARKEVFAYLAIVGFVLNSVIPLIKKLWFKDAAWPFSVGVVSGYLIYLAIGYLIYNYDMPKKYRLAVYILGIAGFLLHCVGTHVLSMRDGSIVQTYKGYANVPCVMYSTAVFTFLKYKGEKIMSFLPVNIIVNMIAPYTLGIYLLQYFIYTTIILKTDVDTHSLLYRLGAPLLIVPLAILIQWLLRKVPVLKYIVP